MSRNCLLSDEGVIRCWTLFPFINIYDQMQWGTIGAASIIDLFIITCRQVNSTNSIVHIPQLPRKTHRHYIRIRIIQFIIKNKLRLCVNVDDYYFIYNVKNAIVIKLISNALCIRLVNKIPNYGRRDAFSRLIILGAFTFYDSLLEFLINTSTPTGYECTVHFVPLSVNSRDYFTYSSQ